MNTIRHFLSDIFKIYNSVRENACNYLSVRKKIFILQKQFLSSSNSNASPFDRVFQQDLL